MNGFQISKLCFRKKSNKILNRKLSNIATTSCNNATEFDYIVVGSGSAGSVVASKLSENPSNKVLLLEAGKVDNYPWQHIPVGYLYCINNPRADWCLSTQVEKGLNNRSLIYPRGLGVGGCSLINGMIYMRGQKSDFNGWAEKLNDESWRWESILPFYIDQECYHTPFKAEKQDGTYVQAGNDEVNCQHGYSGPWRVEKQRLQWDVLDLFKQAAVDSGVQAINDFNTGCNAGVSYFDINQHEGWRLSAYSAFIKPHIKTRTNLTIKTQAIVKNLLFTHKDDGPLTCSGVHVGHGLDFEHQSSESELKLQQYAARKEVILCAGSIGNVQILERSGVGDYNVIKKINDSSDGDSGNSIPYTLHLPGVGENLQDHLQLRLAYKISDKLKTLNTMVNSVLGQLKVGIEYMLHRTGPMAMAPSQLGIFCKSDSSKTRANIQFHVQPLSLPKFGEDLDAFNGFTVSVCNLQPTSRGSVHITSSDVFTKPSIAPNYLSTPDDCQVAADSISVARRIIQGKHIHEEYPEKLEGSVLSPYNPEEVRPGVHLVSNEELVDGARAIGTTIFHPSGTCKMGLASDPMAVVDSQLRVHGVQHLRIADCSIMPTITSGNTAAPTMMIGGKCAHMVLSA